MKERIREIVGKQCYFDKSLCVNVNSNCMGKNCNHCTVSKILAVFRENGWKSPEYVARMKGGYKSKISQMLSEIHTLKSGPHG